MPVRLKTTVLMALSAALLLLVISGFMGRAGIAAEPPALTVAIAPYQDLAMLTVYKKLGLEAKYGTRIQILTLPWEEIQPSLASAGKTIDVGFGSLIEFLTKYQNVNTANSDPLVYVYPAYVFKGGGFVSFNKNVPDLDEAPGFTEDRVRTFLSFKIGAGKNSMFDMMIFSLARRTGVPRSEIKLVDTTMADGLLAAEGGAIDAAAGGLTQRNEALEKGGRVVLTMEKLGFADLTGIICRQSTLDRRHKDIENLVKMWFDSVNYVYSDIDHNSAVPLDYLAKTASTKYTVASFKRALEAEYLPRSIADADRDMVAENGEFSIKRISGDISAYLVELGIAKVAPPTPMPIDIRQ
jgi:ABC-type nitrate/sulfonate/bicarbonate transport system substrate-binding protein